MGKNTKVKAGSVLAGVAVMAEMMSPGTVMAATQNHNNKPYITNQVTELLIQEIDEANGTIKVVVSENGLTEGSREKVVENESGEVTLEKIVDISDWTYRQLNVMVATGISDADLYILTSGRGMGPTIFNQTYETVDIVKDTPTVLNETEVGALRSSEDKELVYSLGVSYYFAETGRNRTWYIPGRINYSSCFEGLENMTGVVCEAETYEGEDGMLMVRYKPKEGTGVPVDTNENGGESGDSGGEAGDSGNDDLGENSGGDSEGTGLDNGNSAGAGSDDGNSVNTGDVGDNTDDSGSGGDSSGGEGGNNESEGAGEGEEGEFGGGDGVGEGSGGEDGTGGDSEEIGNSEDLDSSDSSGDSGSSDNNEKTNVLTVVKEVPVIQEVVRVVEKEVPVELRTVETVVKTAVQEVPVTRTLVREVAGRTVYVASNSYGNSDDSSQEEIKMDNNIKDKENKDSNIKKDTVRNSEIEAGAGEKEATEVPALGDAETKNNWWLPFMIGMASGGLGVGVAWWIMGRGREVKE